MKQLATITDEDGNEIALSFEPASGVLFEGSEPTGPEFESEERAAEYIHDSWGVAGT